MMSRNTTAVCALALTALLTGCASTPTTPRSYVALLPSPDGSVGSVTVSSAKGEQTLTQAYTATATDASRPAFALSKEQLEKDFGAAQKALPALPEHFLLYFESGSTLTAESSALLATILERARSRTAADASVIGHTDTKGKPEVNEALALTRASAIAEQLKQLGLQNLVLTVESHGERNLLVPTPDETAEPRNRRVEITLR